MIGYCSTGSSRIKNNSNKKNNNNLLIQLFCTHSNLKFNIVCATLFLKEINSIFIYIKQCLWSKIICRIQHFLFQSDLR